MSNRVVVTGVGVVSPLGLTAKDSWDSLIRGDIPITPLPSNYSGIDSKIASQICDFVPENYINKKDIKKMDRFIQLGIAASKEAIEDSGWSVEKDSYNADRTGVLVGSGIGGLASIETTSVGFHSNNSRVSPFFIPASLINLLSGHIAINNNFSGPNSSVSTACATGTHAIGDAFRMIKYGFADVMVAGGAEAPITPVGVKGFASAKALSTQYNDKPKLASRPWDKGRDGFVIGEGAAVLILEEYNHAKERGAKIYCEILGYGMTGDAFHITTPSKRGGLVCMRNAIEEASIELEAIDYINAHGTSTPTGDKNELDMVSECFHSVSKKIHMSSLKSSVGHLLGAAGSFEAAMSLFIFSSDILPATYNLTDPIETPEFIDLVPNAPKEVKVDYILSNSFGFGGTNATLVFSRLK